MINQGFNVLAGDLQGYSSSGGTHNTMGTVTTTYPTPAKTKLTINDVYLEVDGSLIVEVRGNNVTVKPLHTHQPYWTYYPGLTYPLELYNGAIVTSGTHDPNQASLNFTGEGGE